MKNLPSQPLRTIVVPAGIIEDMLNKGLRVLMPGQCIGESKGFEEGDFLEMMEAEEIGKPSGRIFYAQVTHCPDPECAQIMLGSTMKQWDHEAKEYVNYPMAGEFANEKVQLPEGGHGEISVSGLKPVWVYHGVKWLLEISIEKLFFSGHTQKLSPHPMTMMAPQSISLKVSGPGGERSVNYVRMLEVKP